jgi:hypothetical protein
MSLCFVPDGGIRVHTFYQEYATEYMYTFQSNCWLEFAVMISLMSLRCHTTNIIGEDQETLQGHEKE